MGQISDDDFRNSLVKMVNDLKHATNKQMIEVKKYFQELELKASNTGGKVTK